MIDFAPRDFWSQFIALDAQLHRLAGTPPGNWRQKKAQAHWQFLQAEGGPDEARRLLEIDWWGRRFLGGVCIMGGLRAHEVNYAHNPDIEPGQVVSAVEKNFVYAQLAVIIFRGARKNDALVQLRCVTPSQAGVPGLFDTVDTRPKSNAEVYQDMRTGLLVPSTTEYEQVLAWMQAGVEARGRSID